MTSLPLNGFVIALVLATGCGDTASPEAVAAQFVTAVDNRDCPALSEIGHPDEARLDCADPELDDAWLILAPIAEQIAQRLAVGDRFEIDGERARLEYDCGVDSPCVFELALHEGDWYVADVD